MFSWLFLIGSFSYLQVMRTYIKAYMSLNFGQIPPLTTELAALERLKNRFHHVISVNIDPIFFKLAGNKNMHNIMNEFQFQPDRTTDYGVSCPWASKKYPHRPYNGENGISTFSLLFLIGSFWYFHVTRTSIKAWMSSNFFKWDLTLEHWTQVSDHCPLGYLFTCLLIFLKLCTCFLHGLEMCMWFEYNPWINFCHFFRFVYFVIFWPQILWKCIDSGYLVGATPYTISVLSSCNFAHLFPQFEDVHVVWI